MSRIGKKIVDFSGLNVKAEDGFLTIEKGNLSKKIRIPDGIEADVLNNQIKVTALDHNSRKFQGLIRTLINNAVIGLSSNFSVSLDLVGVGYKVEQKGNKLILNLGFSHPVEYELPEGIDCAIERMQKSIQQYQATLTVRGWDKERVGQVAADLVALKRPDAYKGKGIRYADRPLVLKPGKSGTKGSKK
ncbi:MAG: 50S ribosomal protein L6 [Chloracidobacterium sp.]|nr:50S ribosomal protein L6 [Chloracidobacterium sp.]MDW8217309.1 50S ribosomal protein L6 [Acidobacteriota bacterium]